MIHTMLDIETMSTSNNALVMSIGAVKFDATSIVDRFHVGIEPQDAQRCGLDLSADTVLWWLDPDRAEARKALLDLGRVDLFSALDGFAVWVLQTPQSDLGSVWGNGVAFDNVILKNAYDKLGLEFPFSYKQDACYRTLRRLVPEVEFERVGTHHSALDDAESQALHLQKICTHLGVKL